jgi:hypothetical protein
MQENNFEQLIQEELNKLPKYVRESLSFVKWLDTLQKVTQENHVHIDQVGEVRTETLLVLLGLIDSVEYVGKISEILDIKGDTLSKFITDVNERVFTPVRDEILKRRKASEKEGVTTQEKPVKESASTTSSKSFITQKLNQTSHTTQKETDYSVKRKDKVDPYREPVD